MKRNTDRMDGWEFDKPAFVDEEEQSLKQILANSKTPEEATEKLGYDPEIFELDLKATLEKGVVIIRDKSAHNPELQKQYKQYLKERNKADSMGQEKMKFEYKEPPKKVFKTPIKKIKMPKCFGEISLSSRHGCNACLVKEMCKKAGNGS